VRVTILGLGEAGGRIAGDLVALGVEVCGWDPDPARGVDGVASATDSLDAVGASAVVLSLNSSSAAVPAAESVAAALGPGLLYADLNTASARVKLAVAEVVTARGAAFADVALLAPVLLHGVRTPALASGGGAEEFAARFVPLGMPVEVVGPEPGAASERKLLRSVFMKGLAAALVESLRAAEAAGCEDWLRADAAAVLETADAALVDRLVDGSRVHAVRRVTEMEAAAELLRDLGVEPRIATAAAEWLSQLAAEREPATEPSS
jgi:3-hydroxyisobutyrate dehydrogenase-like beta-hydroxyacid dehydrogenase